MSLKDQLVKAGLVSAKQARQAEHRERVEHKQAPRTEAKLASRAGSTEAKLASRAGSTEATPASRAGNAAARAEEVRREQEAQRERDRLLNRERLAQQAEQERLAQERDRRCAWIETAFREGRIEHWSGIRTYCFADGTRIESLGVSDDAARRLQEGRAAIVRTDDPRAPYTLLHAAQALRLKEVAPERIVTLHGQ